MLKTPLKVYWWRGEPGEGNFGDELNRWICQELSGRPVRHAPAHLADLIAIGSILEPWFWRERRNEAFAGVIWGAGRMFGAHPLRFPRARIVALRGHGTRNTLTGAGAVAALGDPGLLAPVLQRSTPEADARYQVGVMPHWSEREHPKIRTLASVSSEVCVIDPCGSVPEVLEAMAACRRILSSSLHGLIVADALGIPSEWLRLKTGREDQFGLPEFKYRDYYSLFGLADKEYVELGDAETLESLIRKFGEPQERRVEPFQRALLEAFPFKAA